MTLRAFLPQQDGRTFPAEPGGAAVEATFEEVAAAQARLRRQVEAVAWRRHERDAWLAHALKTPLTIITAQVGVLRQQARREGGPDDARLEAGLARIEAAAAEMAMAIDDLDPLASRRRSEPGPADERPAPGTDVLIEHRAQPASRQLAGTRAVLSAALGGREAANP